MTESTERSIRLRARVEPRGPAAAIVLSEAQVASLDAGKAPPVRLRVGEVAVPARIARRGDEFLLGLSRQLRSDLGVEIGDTVDAVITVDRSPRPVDVPPALAEALSADAKAAAAFDALAPSHRKEFARWVAEAKRPQTRASRVSETIRRLREGAAGSG